MKAAVDAKGCYQGSITTKQQFTCAHCHASSPMTGVVNKIVDGHSDWIACIYCNKLTRMVLARVIDAPSPIIVTRTYKDGHVISQEVCAAILKLHIPS
jgi:hypothetical protein